jgi:hypothetical protein
MRRPDRPRRRRNLRPYMGLRGFAYKQPTSSKLARAGPDRPGTRAAIAVDTLSASCSNVGTVVGQPRQPGSRWGLRRRTVT